MSPHMPNSSRWWTVKYTGIQYGLRPVCNWAQAHEYLEQEANAYMQYRELHGEPRLAKDDVLSPGEDYRECPEGGTAATLSSNVFSIELVHELAIMSQTVRRQPRVPLLCSFSLQTERRRAWVG